MFKIKEKEMKKIVYLLLAFVSFASFGIAAESTPAEAASWSPIIAKIGVIILDVITPVLYALSAWAVYKLGRKFGVDATVVSESQIKSIVKKGVNYVEGWAKKQAAKPSSNDKMAKAIDFINEGIVSSGLKKKSSEYLMKMIESQLEWDNKTG